MKEEMLSLKSRSAFSQISSEPQFAFVSESLE